MPIRESILISWTIENNDFGQWALFARVGGPAVLMSNWYDTKEQLVEALKGLLTAHPIPESTQA
jgi:hypothetical protein